MYIKIRNYLKMCNINIKCVDRLNECITALQFYINNEIDADSVQVLTGLIQNVEQISLLCAVTKCDRQVFIK